MDMKKKYFLTDETKQIMGHKLHRIQAVRKFGMIQEGQKGGWVEKESNLSHSGMCWLFDDAFVMGDAVVKDNAWVCNNTCVRDLAEVSEFARVWGHSIISGSAIVTNQAYIKNSIITHQALVNQNAYVYNSSVEDNAHVGGYVVISSNVRVKDSSSVIGVTHISNGTDILGNSMINANTHIHGTMTLRDARIFNNTDFIIFKNWWSSGRYFVWTRSNDMWSVGCFFGTGEELVKKAYRNSQLSGDEYKRVVDYVESIKHKINAL